MHLPVYHLHTTTQKRLVARFVLEDLFDGLRCLANVHRRGGDLKLSALSPPNSK